MIEILNEGSLFHLTAGGTSSVLMVKDGQLFSLYWGKAIAASDLDGYCPGYQQSSFDENTVFDRLEFDPWDGRHFTVPSLKKAGGEDRFLHAEFAGYKLETACKAESAGPYSAYAKEVAAENGAGVAENGGAGAAAEVDRLTIFMNIAPDGITAALEYELFPDGMLAKRTRLSAESAVELESVTAASAVLPEKEQVKAHYTSGKWNGEWVVNEHAMPSGTLVLQSRRGTTSHHANPSLALAEPEAGENFGKVWWCQLGYSGSWSIQAERTGIGTTRVSLGENPFDFSVTVSPDNEYVSPWVYLGFTEGGFGTMSRKSHRFLERYILPKRQLRRVLYNSWEATTFAVKASEQKRLAEKAARMGCELFVVDDGWFGERNSEHAGLGDWFVNETKFPDGLDDLIDYVKSLGMEFGIWLEPEAVNPDSDLYRAHPDWAFHTADREPLRLRDQVELNFGLPEVQEYILNVIRDLLEKHDIRYIKWDMNRPIADVDGALVEDDPRTLWRKHTDGVYMIWDTLRKEFPHVELETCSGGGGRIDPGILRYADEFWTSDNTDPYDRLMIQYGCTQFYPASGMMCWVTDTPETSGRAKRALRYKFHSSFAGGLGIGANINHFSDAEIAYCGSQIELYKDIRHIVLEGDLYRIGVPGKDNVTAVQYVHPSTGESVVLMFLHSGTFADPQARIRLMGLDPDRKYDVRYFGAAQPENTDIGDTFVANADAAGDAYWDNAVRSFSGSTLMGFGIGAPLKGDFDSRCVVIRPKN